MKKFLLSTLILSSLLVNAAPVTPDEALARIQKQGGAMKLGTLKEAELSLSLNASDGLPSLYVFDNSSGGFMILSADDMAPALVGYSQNSGFNPDNISPSLQAWLNEYTRQIEFLRANPILSGNYEGHVSYDPSWTPVKPMISTKWDQEVPYNNLCPTYDGQRCVTGCVATAMSQIMNYFQFPKKGEGFIQYTPSGFSRPLSLDFGEQEFDWDNMLDIYVAGNYNDEQADAVAYLMKACGYATEMQYSPYGSGAFEDAPAYALTHYFGYSPSAHFESREYYTAQEWSKMVYDNLMELGPVCYGATSLTGAHQFVCDGYDGNGYFHINWGWSGISDGYFLLDVLTPVIQGTGGSLNGYNVHQSAIFGITPFEHSEPVPSLSFSGYLNGILEGDVLYLQVMGSNSYLANFESYPFTAQLVMLVYPEGSSVDDAVFYEIPGMNFYLEPGRGLVFDENAPIEYLPYIDLTNIELKDNVKYRFTLASRNEIYYGTFISKVKATVGNPSYVFVTHTDSGYLIESIQPGVISVESMQMLTPLFENRGAKVAVTFANTYIDQLSTSLCAVLTDENGGMCYITDSFFQTVNVDSQTVEELELNFNLLQNAPVSGIGDYYLRFLNNENDTFIDSTPLKVSMNDYEFDMENLKASLSITNAVREEDLYIVQSSDLIQASLTLSVTKGFYSNRMALYIVDLDSTTGDIKVMEFAPLTKIPVVNENETVVYNMEIPFHPENPDYAYTLLATFENNNEQKIIRETMIEFVMTPEDEHPDDPEDPDEPRDLPDLPEPVITPEPGVIATGWFDTFGIRWGYNNLEVVNPGAVSVTFNETPLEIVAVQAVETQETEESPIYESGQLVVILADLQMQTGDYTVHIPAGTVNVIIEGVSVPNDDIEFTYTIEEHEAPELPDYTVNPTPGEIEILKEIMISWNNDQLNLNGECHELISFTVNGEDGGEVEFSFEGEPTTGSLGDKFLITLPEEYTKAGEYIISIPEGFLFVNDEEAGTLPSPSITLVYTIPDNGNTGDGDDNGDDDGDDSGISSVKADNNGNYYIFTTNGILIKKTSESSDLRNLVPGLYIINRKKVMISPESK